MKKIFIIALSLVTLLTFTYNCNNQAFAKKKKSSSSVKIIEFEAFDGFNIKGKLYLPKVAKGKKVPLVLLLHSVGKDRNSWQNLPDMIKQNGYACLVLDQRGHGKSTYNKNLQKRTWYYFTYKNYAHFPDDVLAAIDYIQTVYHKKIDTNQMMFVGADIGASAAVISAAKLNKKRARVLSLVLISPTIKLKGLFLPIELVNYGKHPILVFVSRTHKESLRDTFELKKYAQGEYKINTFYRGGIGALLYKEKPVIQEDIIDWSTKTFSPDRYQKEQKNKK